MLDKIKLPALYSEMKAAIAKCHRVDECKRYADKAHALAAYYKQTQDVESQRYLNDIKLRAWRQMGTLLLEIDLAGCDTNAKRLKVLRWYYPGDISYVTDHHLTQAIKLAEIADTNFESSVASVLAAGSGSVQRVIQESPEYLAERRRKEKEWQAKEQQRQDAIAAYQTQQAKKGKTKPQKAMTPTVLRWHCLVNRTAHDQWREAAIKQDMTMHQILRDGLNLWMTQHGYKELPKVAFWEHE